MKGRLHGYIENPLLIGYALLMHFGRWLPDRLYIKLQYLFYMGKRLSLKNPETFTEKIQWLKLYNRKEEYHQLVDKCEVKKIVASIIGEEYIIPTLGGWDSFDEINFLKLPDKFVLKTTQGSHSSMICRDKRCFDKERAKKSFETWMKSSPYEKFREWAYKGIKPRIIAEQYLELKEGEDLVDYKFYCFDGQPLYCQVIKDRTIGETIDFFDKDWNHQEFFGLQSKVTQSKVTQSKVTQSKVTIARPINYEKMLEIAEKLSQGVPFLRVDLYNLDGKIYFGELTFYPAAGLGYFTPDEWNLRLGKLIKLPSIRKIAYNKV